MEQNEIKTLKILEALEENPNQSQRELSNKLEFSLGLVNAFTKRLAKMGYFKIKTIPRNRACYILTPKGMTEKIKLTCQYIRYSMQFYRESREKFREIFESLSEQEIGKIFFYGVSEIAEVAYITLQETGFTLTAIIDEATSQTKFMGFTVKNLSFLNTFAPGDIMLITTLDSQISTNKRLTDFGIRKEQIIDFRTF